MNRVLQTRPLRWAGFFISVVAIGYAVFSIATGASASSNVTGSVKDPSGNGYPGQVCFNGPSGGNCAQADISGNYTMSVNAGSYTGTASAPSMAYAGSLEQKFEVVDGQTVTANFTLTTIQMSGKLQKADGTAINGGLNVHSADWSTNVHANADQNGNYVVGGLPAGDYTADAFVNWGVTGLTAPDPVSVTIGSTPITQNFTFSAAAKTLTGTVRKTDGSTVATACINANKMGSQGWANGHVDANGVYTLSLSGGNWSVQVSPCEPAADWIYDGQPMNVGFGDDTSTETKTLDITVKAATASVSGTITDTAGTAVTSGNVDIRNASGVGISTQVNNGSYRAYISPGTYEVRYWSPSGQYALPQTSVTVADNENKTLNLVLTVKQAHIKGTVFIKSSGAPASNAPVNAFEMKGPNGGPGNFGNGRSAADGTFDILVTKGTYGLNVGQEPGSKYVAVNSGPSSQVVLDSDTATSAGNTLYVESADATINVSVTAGGRSMSNMQGCVYARPAGTFNETCQPINPQSGIAELKVSSLSGSTFEVGCHLQSNSDFSCGSPTTATVTTGSTTAVTIDLTQNNSSISGKVFDSSGFPLSDCSTLKGAQVFLDNGGSHYQSPIDEKTCSYRVSLVAGVYFFNANFPPESGALNPPPGKPVQVFTGQSVEKNIMFTKADAQINVTVVDENGNRIQNAFVDASNDQEIQAKREGQQGGGPGGPGTGPGGKGGADIGFGKNTPCGASDVNGIMKCCSKAENKKVCQAFTVPDGPNGCKNAYDCVQQCKKSPGACNDKGTQPQGSQPGQGDFKAGPGGCTDDASCQKYCSAPEHFDECSKFKPPENAKSVRVSAFGKVKAAADSGNSGGDDKSGFDNMIRASGPAMNGSATIQALSGHVYTVRAFFPPGTSSMPPKSQTCDLTTAKSCTILLQSRKADAVISGKVLLDGKPTSPFHVYGWAEDGSNSDSGSSGDGSYSMNLTCNTTWHIGADSFQDTTFYRADETILVVDCATKKFSQDITLVKQDFEVPHPVTVSGTCSSTLTLGMSNGAKLEIPGGAISSSESGTCTCTASPTIDLISTKSDQPQGSGYTIECRDENSAVVSKLSSSATFTVPYKLPKSLEGTSYEDALKPVFFDSTVGAYKTVSSYTVDKDNNVMSFSIDHFSAYTVSNGSGTSAKNGALISVTTSKKAGKTVVKAGSKSFTPFSCKGDVSVVTKSVNGTQLIATGASCDANLKVYDTNGKIQKKIGTGWSGINALAFDDVTKDGNADIAAAPTRGKDVKVYQPYKKYAAMTVNAASNAGKLTVNSVDFSGTGIDSLVTGVVANGTAGSFQVYKFAKNKFSVITSAYSGYLNGNGGVISLSVPKATVTSFTPKAGLKSSVKLKITVTGKNFTPDSSVMVGSVSGKTAYKSTTKLIVTIDATNLGAGSFTIKVTNPGGTSATSKGKVKIR